MMIQKEKIESLDWLIKVAKQSPNGYRHAAGIYSRSGKLILACANRYHEHAEFRVILRYFALDKYRRQKISYMVIIRLSRNATQLSPSQPCIKCKKILDSLNIRVIHS